MSPEEERLGGGAAELGDLGRVEAQLAGHGGGDLDHAADTLSH
jgi:hypothetical protein